MTEPDHRRPDRGEPRERLLALGVLLTFLGFYLLIGSRERPWVDARVMYEVAEQLVGTGHLNVKTSFPPMSHAGPDGKLYSIYGLFTSLASVPGVLMRNGIARLWPAAGQMALAVTCHLATSLFAAWTCLIFLGLCRRHGAGLLAASLSTAILGAGTLVLIYARQPFSESLQALCFTGFAAALCQVAEEPTPRRALSLGAWAGALVNTKLIFALSLAGGALFVLWALHRDRRALLRVVLYSLPTLAPLLLVAGAYNWLRWGSPLLTGYESVTTSMAENPFWGLWGLLFSSGKSALLFSPPLLAGALCAPAFARRYGKAALGLSAAALPVVLTYARFTFWGGDWCWGPRYMNFLVPVALLPVAPALQRWLAPRRQRNKLAFLGALAAIGLFVQVLGTSFYWDHYIRLTLVAKTEWLGNPNRSGSPLLDLGGKEVCAACIEDLYAHDWLPPFSPIDGHLWLLRHKLAKDDVRWAEKDAPWRRYTRLSLPIDRPYREARLDWWGFMWTESYPRFRFCGLALGLLFSLLFLGGAGLWRWAATSR